MSGVAQRLYQQHLRTQTRAVADPKRTLGKAEVRAHALSFVGRQARHLPEAELVAGAAHHLARLRKAVEVDNRVVAARHAHAYSIYERLLGHVPSDEGSATVSQRCLQEGASLVKSEAKTFEAFRRDEQVRETVLWSETLEKATGPKCRECGKPVNKKRHNISGLVDDSGESFLATGRVGKKWYAHPHCLEHYKGKCSCGSCPEKSEVEKAVVEPANWSAHLGETKHRMSRKALVVEGAKKLFSNLRGKKVPEESSPPQKEPAEQVKKALPAPDPRGPKIPKPPVAGAPIAAERKAKFGNKTSATAPTAAPTPKPPSMPTKATTKAPKVPAAPKPAAGTPKAPNQSSGAR